MYLERAPSIPELLDLLEPVEVVNTLEASADILPQGRYLHWDKLRRLNPPAGLTSEQWWLKVKMARAGGLCQVPLTDADGNRFGYTQPDIVHRHLHHVDQRCSGEVAMDEVVTSEREAGTRFLVNSLMEEAIRSSQLEGATTSRGIAKELLLSGRPPRNRSERMIANNYRALQFMRDEMSEAISPDSVLELHRVVTEGTLHDSSAAGRLPERMELLCRFANGGDEGEAFIHPVVRAILLHFWLAYDHPFEDGNGRTARILFYWAMQSRGYWLAEYLPISRFIRNAPARYAKAFMETETDGGDTTYFLIHQLGVIEQAIDELHRYLKRKVAEVRDVERLLHGTDDLNGRQLALLTEAARHPDALHTFASHSRSHRVTHETARTDLRNLVERGLLVQRRSGRRHIFEAAPDLSERLKESPA